MKEISINKKRRKINEKEKERNERSPMNYYLFNYLVFAKTDKVLI